MERLYFATLLALVLHQIDAAFWHEWEMFAAPGGVQGFVAFNLVAVGLLLHGYRRVAQAQAYARRWALICGATGVATFLLHVVFAAAGHRQFALPASMLVLLACLLGGSALVVVALRAADARP